MSTTTRFNGNITQLCESIEREIGDNDAQVTSARSEIERLVSEAELQGRATLTAGADARANALFADINRLSAASRRQEARLVRAREIEAEEVETEKRLNTVHKTGEPRQNGTATVPVAGLTYGAGGSYDAAEESPWMDSATGRRASLGRNERFADHEAVRDEIARHAERDKILVGTHGTFAQQVRSLSTGGSPGVVPTVWASSIIDKARNNSVCLNAGVTVVPMPSKIYQIGRLNADVAPAYKTEGSAINVSDPGFDFIQLSATTLGSLTVASYEFLADAVNADQVLQEAIGKAMSLEIDKAILFGQLLTADGSEGYNLPTPYPRGVLKTLLALAPTQVLPGSPWTNGTVQTAASFFRELQSLVFSVKRRNETPGALVSNDALYQKYVDAYDSQNRPLPLPSNLAAMQWLTTNAINSATQGTTTTASDVFCGDWSQVLLGQRLGIEIRVLTERYAELGQVGILAYSRNDVQLARLSAMGVYRYLQAAV
jgi:HK97 family phage major capsid protein